MIITARTAAGRNYPREPAYPRSCRSVPAAGPSPPPRSTHCISRAQRCARNAIPTAKYAITRAGNDRCRCSLRFVSASTSSTSAGGNTRVSSPTDTRSDRRRSDGGFFHPARGTPPNYTPVVLTERYCGLDPDPLGGRLGQAPRVTLTVTATADLPAFADQDRADRLARAEQGGIRELDAEDPVRDGRRFLGDGELRRAGVRLWGSQRLERDDRDDQLLQACPSVCERTGRRNLTRSR